MLSDYGIESNKKTQHWHCRHRNCLLKASLTFTDVPGLLCRVVVWPMESLGSSSRNYSDFDNWKCTSPRQHQHCTGSGLGWPSFLPPSNTVSSLSPGTPVAGGLGLEEQEVGASVAQVWSGVEAYFFEGSGQPRGELGVDLVI